jgi:hypothetical protein
LDGSYWQGFILCSALKKPYQHKKIAPSKLAVHYNGLPNASLLELYDITGRQLAAYPINGTDGDLVVPTSTYPSGIYIVVVRTEKGLLSQQKLVIE